MIDIWKIPEKPTQEQMKQIQGHYGFWLTGQVMIVREFLEKHCQHLKPAPPVDPILDTSNMTVEELRQEGSRYFHEADRLTALPERKQLYALRVPDKEPLFIDPKEDAVRYYALQNPREDAWLYHEEWTKDGEKWHILTRTKMDNPVQTAESNKR